MPCKQGGNIGLEKGGGGGGFGQGRCGAALGQRGSYTRCLVALQAAKQSYSTDHDLLTQMLCKQFNATSRLASQASNNFRRFNVTVSRDKSQTQLLSSDLTGWLGDIGVETGGLRGLVLRKAWQRGGGGVAGGYQYGGEGEGSGGGQEGDLLQQQLLGLELIMGLLQGCL